MFVAGLRPELAIAAALITEAIGMASGGLAYARLGLIDYRLGAGMLATAVPAAAWAPG